jgi:hypothetical protein
MPKYKISKSNLKEFFGLFGKKKKPKDLQSLIDRDPKLQQLDKEMQNISKKYVADITPEQEKIFKKYGIL